MTHTQRGPAQPAELFHCWVCGGDFVEIAHSCQPPKSKAKLKPKRRGGGEGKGTDDRRHRTT